MDWMLGVLGLVVGIVGAWITLHHSRKSNPLFSIRHIHLDLVSHPNLHVRFKNRRVDRLSVIRFVFWNGGKREIRREDIPDSPAGPRVHLPEGTTVLDQRIVATTGDQSAKFSSITECDMSLDFEFLNRNDAFLAEILCEHAPNSRRAATIKGTIMGANLQKGEIHNLSRFDGGFFVLILVALIGLSFLTGYSTFNAFLDDKYMNGFMLSILTLIVVAMTYLNLRANVLSIPNKLPAKYDRFLCSGVLPSSSESETVWDRDGV